MFHNGDKFTKVISCDVVLGSIDPVPEARLRIVKLEESSVCVSGGFQFAYLNAIAHECNLCKLRNGINLGENLEDHHKVRCYFIIGQVVQGQYLGCHPGGPIGGGWGWRV